MLTMILNRTTNRSDNIAVKLMHKLSILKWTVFSSQATSQHERNGESYSTFYVNSSTIKSVEELQPLQW